MTLVLRDNTSILASSVILSLNSPVFDRLTTDLGLKTIEMDDFEEGAVWLFIESFYTGEMEEIKEQNFRDLNKMSKVFEVLWLRVICRDYFEQRLRSLTNKDFDGMFFLFAEVCYMEEFLKDSSLTRCVIKHIQYLDTGNCVVLKKYAKKVLTLSKIAGNNVYFLLKVILSNLKKGRELHGNILYLLQKVSLCVGREQDADTFEQVFETLRTLENQTTDDLRMSMTLYAKSMREFCERRTDMVDSPSRAIPNLFRRSWKNIRPWMNPIAIACQDFLSIAQLMEHVKHNADDMYMLVSISLFIFTGFFNLYRVSSLDLHKKSISELVDKVVDQTIQRMIEIRQEMRWSKICPEYLHMEICTDDYCLENFNEKTRIILNKFISNLRESEITSGIQSVMLRGPETNYVFFEEFLTVGRKYKFYFKHPAIESCCEPGNCGFMLEVNPVLPGNPESFNIELCTLPEEYKTDIHFHDTVKAEKMHFALLSRSIEDDKSCIINTSYLGRPTWNNDKIVWGSYKDKSLRRNATMVRPIIFYDLT